MKLDGATIPIEGRSTAACIDLAFCFYRAHLREILALTSVFAVPSLSIVYCAAKWTEDGALICLFSFLLLAPWLGTTLVAGAGRRAFGDSFDVKKSLQSAIPRPIILRILVTPLRFLLIPLMFMVYFRFLTKTGGPSRGHLEILIPIVLIFYASTQGCRSFLAEVAVLENLQGRNASRRLKAFYRNNRFFLIGHVQAIVLFTLLLSMVLMIALEFTVRTLFGYSLISGESSASFQFSFLEGWDRLGHHPVVLCCLQGVFWLTYPLSRLSWFFTYLDRRIRAEGWDIELEFRILAKKMGSPS